MVDFVRENLRVVLRKMRTRITYSIRSAHDTGQLRYLSKVEQEIQGNEKRTHARPKEMYTPTIYFSTSDSWFDAIPNVVGVAFL